MIETEGARKGQCKLNPGCPTTMGCREVRNAESGATGCFPRFPLWGKPGTKTGCQPGDSSEPFGDAWDCMADEDKDPVTWVLVNYAKATELGKVEGTLANGAGAEAKLHGFNLDHFLAREVEVK